jgi:hypothetical protein
VPTSQAPKLARQRRTAAYRLLVPVPHWAPRCGEPIPETVSLQPGGDRLFVGCEGGPSTADLANRARPAGLGRRTSRTMRLGCHAVRPELTDHLGLCAPRCMCPPQQRASGRRRSRWQNQQASPQDSHTAPSPAIEEWVAVSSALSLRCCSRAPWCLFCQEWVAGERATLQGPLTYSCYRGRPILAMLRRRFPGQVRMPTSSRKEIEPGRSGRYTAAVAQRLADRVEPTTR